MPCRLQSDRACPLLDVRVYCHTPSYLTRIFSPSPCISPAATPAPFRVTFRPAPESSTFSVTLFFLLCLEDPVFKCQRHTYSESK